MVLAGIFGSLAKGIIQIPFSAHVSKLIFSERSYFLHLVSGVQEIHTLQTELRGRLIPQRTVLSGDIIMAQTGGKTALRVPVLF